MDFYEIREIGRWEYIISLIRANMEAMSVEEMAKLFRIPEKDCRVIVELIDEYPEWNDEMTLRGALGYKAGATETWDRVYTLVQRIISQGGNAEEAVQVFNDDSFRAEMCQKYDVDPW